MKRTIALLLIAVALFVVGAVKAFGSSYHPQKIQVRWCPEDAVHVGQGQFDGTRWSWYRCIARDDL
jgi:hypothetical protein